MTVQEVAQHITRIVRSKRIQRTVFAPPAHWQGEVWTPAGHPGMIRDFTPDESRCYVRYFNAHTQSYGEKWFDTTALNGRRGGE